jgi:branched-chain amino acid aminotransferase
MQIVDNSIVSQPDYSLNPHELEFGKAFAANMFSCEFRDGAWRQDGELKALETFNLHPASLVFHYAQGVFEGMKAYKGANGEIRLFRPQLNARRMCYSAWRMALPEFPEEWFLSAVRAVVLANKDYIPEAPGSLYIRPTLIGTEACLGVRASAEAVFFVICLPSGSFFKSDVPGPGAVDVLVSEDAPRAFRGGTGSAKAAANYAISLKTIKDAKEMGCAQVLFLDAAEHKYVEEMGGMNVLFSDGKKLITPELTDTILDGVTRRSIIDLARDEGIPVEERKVTIDEIVTGARNGTITEGIACGTAAVVTSIRSLKLSRSQEVVKFATAPGPLTERIFNDLTGIQYGRREDPFCWGEVIG